MMEKTELLLQKKLAWNWRTGKRALRWRAEVLKDYRVSNMKILDSYAPMYEFEE